MNLRNRIRINRGSRPRPQWTCPNCGTKVFGVSAASNCGKPTGAAR